MKRSGQTLLETIIALAMFIGAFLGIASLLSRSFFLNRVATNETIATYLASEGIEITKNIIDHDVYAGNSWGASVIANPQPYCPTIQDEHLFVQQFCLNMLNRYLRYDPALGYQYFAGPRTQFSRQVFISWGPDNDIDVRSEVTWSTGPFTQGKVVEADNFYDWHP